MTDAGLSVRFARPALVVSITIAVQALVSMGLMILPTIAPRAAAALDVSSSVIGFQVSLVYGFATVMSLFGGRFVGRLGAVRTSQIALALVAGGLVLAATPSLLAIALGSVLMGLAYGLPNPAASHLLMRFTPAQRRNLMFSLKQTGVPLGGVLAGVIAPRLAEVIDWRAPLWITAIAAVSLAVSFVPLRASWDADRDPTRPLFRAPLEGLRAVLNVAPLRHLCAVGFLLAAVQVCFVTFLVVLLVEDYGFSIVAAGMAVAAVQVAGVLGRIAWGMVADANRDGLRTLLVIAASIAVFTFVLSLFAQSTAFVLALLVALGATAISWNGVFLAETARLAPAGRVGEATAIILSLTYLGVFVGPALFALAAPQIGGYRAGFVLLGLLAAASIVFIVAAQPEPARGPLGGPA